MKKNKGKWIFRYLVAFAVFASVLLSLFLWDSSRIGEGNVFAVEVKESEELFEPRYIKRIDGDIYVYNGALLTEELVNQILDIKGIKKASLGTKVSVLMEDIQFPGNGVGNWDYELQKREASKRYGAYYGSGYVVGSKDQYNVLRGYNDTSLINYFRNDALKLVEGTHFTDEDGYKVLISEELAELNQLAVGDTFKTEIKLYDSLQQRVGSSALEIELEVAGIFQVKAEQKRDGYPLKEDLAVNFMFTNNNTVKEFDQLLRQILLQDEEGDPTVYTSAEFFVGNPLSLNGTMKKVEKLVEKESYRVTTSAEVEEEVADVYARINRTTLALTAWFVLAGFVLLLLLFRKCKVSKKNIVGIIIALLLATGITFVGTGLAGNVMLKVMGVEMTAEETSDSEETPLTVKEREEYYDSYELKSQDIQLDAFHRDISIVTILVGEVVLLLMCGVAIRLRRK